MSNIDWSQLITKEMKDAVIVAFELQAKTAEEQAWQTSEMALIADQLLRIDDEDPTALPGTASQWKAYRIKVRAWMTGAVGFPDKTKRPVRPT